MPNKPNKLDYNVCNQTLLHLIFEIVLKYQYSIFDPSNIYPWLNSLDSDPICISKTNKESKLGFCLGVAKFIIACINLSILST